MTMRNRSGVWAPEDDQPLPEPPYFKKILLDLWEGLFTLVVGGLVVWFLLFTMVILGSEFLLLGLVIAAVLVAPAVAGLMVPCAKSARGGFLRLGDAARGVWRLYGRAVVLALPLVVLVAIMSLTSQIASAFPGRQELVFSLALQAGVTLTVVLAHIYIYPVLALFDTSLKQTVLLASALAVKFVWQTLLLALFGVALLAIMPVHPLAPIFVIGPWCVVATNTAWRLARRILPPDRIDK